VIYGTAPPPKKTENLTTRKVGVLLHKLSNDEDEDNTPVTGDVFSSLYVLWHANFHGYLNSRDQIRMMSIVEWWGVHV
jgi:hypothetical protein